MHAASRPEAAEAKPAAAGARGIWSGSISFGLVTVPIELYSAQRPSRTALRMLSPDGNPLQRQYVCPKENRPLEPDEIVRGHEAADGKFVVIDDDELEALAPRHSRNIEISRFVPRDAIDPAHFARAYFMLPGREQDKAYGVLASAMARSNRAAIGHFVMRERAHAVAIFADAGVLRAEILRFGDELRSARAVGLAPAPEPEARRVKQMQRAIEALAEDALDEDELRDEESERLLQIAREKLAQGKDVLDLPDDDSAPPESAGGDVIDLVALLKRQLKPPQAGRRPKRRASGRTKRA